LASARLFYEYAATAGNSTAALRLGGTFDPGFLARAHIDRVQGDAAIALYWYSRARDLGNGAGEILRKMEKPTQSLVHFARRGGGAGPRRRDRSLRDGHRNRHSPHYRASEGDFPSH